MRRLLGINLWSLRIRRRGFQTRLNYLRDIHVAISEAAEVSGKSLDQWVTETFTHAVSGQSKTQAPEC